ncbi:hypothetical protein C8J55DRAFT_602080 [Lentinula edodes]|uniref:Uncharacterized protein n=1 Tax=Lentinula lateritia TaxID=40482 RepID=A0A9W9AY73_9AGAR|nr:hypothetical protein C8J55DRAFT_602080 [Lentinula edodes]
MAHSHRWRLVNLVVSNKFSGKRYDPRCLLSAVLDRTPALEQLSLFYMGDDTLAHSWSEDAVLNSFELASKLTSVSVYRTGFSHSKRSSSLGKISLLCQSIDCVALIHVKPILFLCPKLEQANFSCTEDDRDERDGITPAHSQAYTNHKLKNFTLSYSAFDEDDDVSVIAIHNWILPSLEKLSG